MKRLTALIVIATAVAVCNAQISSSTPNDVVAPNDVAKLLAAKECFMCNLKKVDLSNQNLSGKRLIACNLNEANLTNTNFRNANIASFFDNANLTNARFHHANLIKSDFRNALLTNANFTNADVRGIDFSKARDITGASFKGAILGSVSKDIEQHAEKKRILALLKEKNDLTRKIKLLNEQFTKRYAQQDPGNLAWLASLGRSKPLTPAELGNQIQQEDIKLQAIIKKLNAIPNFEKIGRYSAALLPAKIENVSFENADLTEVNFEGIELNNVNFEGAQGLDLTGAKIGENVKVK